MAVFGINREAGIIPHVRSARLGAEYNPFPLRHPAVSLFTSLWGVFGQVTHV
jgi:hypothetical protein